MNKWLELKGTAGLVARVCGGLVAAVAFILLAWVISGDLELITAICGGIFAAMLVGIAWLAQGGRARLAAWLLCGLLFLLSALDALAFGVGTLAAMAFTLPVVLASRALGLRAGLGAALASSVVVWLVAWATTSGLYEAWSPVDISHLTFNSPVATVILFLLALIAGFGSGKE